MNIVTKDPQRRKYNVGFHEKMIQRIFYFMAVVFVLAIFFTSCTASRTGCPSNPAAKASYRP